MKMYVGNMSFNTTKQDLESFFSQYGQVTDTHLPEDRETGRPRGFAFVTMPQDAAGRAAIEALNGKELDGRTLNVNEARAKTGGGQRSGGGW